MEGGRKIRNKSCVQFLFEWIRILWVMCCIIFQFCAHRGALNIEQYTDRLLVGGVWGHNFLAIVERVAVWANIWKVIGHNTLLQLWVFMSQKDTLCNVFGLYGISKGNVEMGRGK